MRSRSFFKMIAYVGCGTLDLYFETSICNLVQRNKWLLNRFIYLFLEYIYFASVESVTLAFQFKCNFVPMEEEMRNTKCFSFQCRRLFSIGSTEPSDWETGALESVSQLKWYHLHFYCIHSDKSVIEFRTEFGWKRCTSMESNHDFSEIWFHFVSTHISSGLASPFAHSFFLFVE